MEIVIAYAHVEPTDLDGGCYIEESLHSRRSSLHTLKCPDTKNNRVYVSEQRVCAGDIWWRPQCNGAYPFHSTVQTAQPSGGRLAPHWQIGRFMDKSSSLVNRSNASQVSG